MTIRSKISCSLLLKNFDNFFDILGPLLRLFAGTVFLRKAHLAFTLEPPLLEHFLTFLVSLQARYIADFQLSIGRNICLSSKDHHVANICPTHERVAAMINTGSACPNTDGPSIFFLEIVWGVAAFPVILVSKARESECVIKDSIMYKTTIVSIVS